VTETQDPPFGQRLKRGFESTILVPAASAIVRAAASYLIKRLPLILEEKVLPKLLEKDAPKPVVSALEQAATTLGGGPGSANDRSDGEPSDEGDRRLETAASEHATTARAKSMSNHEREEERRKRAQRRRQRKTASAKAA
jgi:hypothetical protein